MLYAGVGTRAGTRLERGAHEDQERFDVAVHVLVPLEVRSEHEVDAQEAARQRLDGRIELQAGHHVDHLLHDLAQLRGSDQLADLCRPHVKVPAAEPTPVDPGTTFRCLTQSAVQGRNSRGAWEAASCDGHTMRLPLAQVIEMYT